MNNFNQKLTLNSKWIAVVLAVFVAVFTYYYTGNLVNKLKIEEQKRIELWAEAYKDILQTDITQKVSLISFKIMQENNTIPVIMTDEHGDIISFANLDSIKATNKSYLVRKLNKMKQKNKPIELVYSDTHRDYIYFAESNLLTLLRKYPYYQAILVIMFLLVVYILLIVSKKAEDNQVWVGMSKETAHQLGTPISSLLAWLELLKMEKSEDPLLFEIEKDIKRLELITERFSRIGSEPRLEKMNLVSVIEFALEYLKPRTSSKINYILKFENKCVNVNLNSALFQWVIENMCKNSIDAMNGVGEITIYVRVDNKKAYIDLSDTGKGMTKNEQKKIFKAGYTTKKYGWGMGLALVKRIIEQYHQGEIFVLKSVLQKGTTIRIILNVND